MYTLQQQFRLYIPILSLQCMKVKDNPQLFVCKFLGCLQ
jgi:hypothetical protein